MINDHDKLIVADKEFMQEFANYVSQMPVTSLNFYHA